MSPSEMNALIGLSGTIFGGIGLKISDYIYNHSRNKTDIATQLRTELRDEATDLQVRVDKLSDEVDTWKGKYYDLLGQFYELKRELTESNLVNTDNKIKIDQYRHDLDNTQQR